MVDDNFGGLKISWVDETGQGGEGKKDGKAGLAGLTAGITAMAGATAAILSLVGEAMSGILKPVKTIVLAVLKQIAQILRPVADVIILLLQPLLIFLKPIIKAFNETLRPFRQAAYKFMAAANQETNPEKKGALMAASMASIFTGLGVGLLTIQGELIKAVIGILLEVFREILEWFRVDVDKLKTNINGFIDTGIDFVENGALKGVHNMAERLGVDLNTNITKMLKTAVDIKMSEVFGEQTKKTSSSSSSVKRIDLTADKGFASYSTDAWSRAASYSGMSTAQILAKMNYDSKLNGR